MGKPISRTVTPTHIKSYISLLSPDLTNRVIPSFIPRAIISQVQASTTVWATGKRATWFISSTGLLYWTAYTNYGAHMGSVYCTESRPTLHNE